MNLTVGRNVLTHLGPGWVAYRIWKAVSEKVGVWERRLPSQLWNEISLSELVIDNRSLDAEAFSSGLENGEAKFVFGDAELDTVASEAAQWDKDSDLSWAGDYKQSLLAGDVRYFSSRVFRQDPPNWFENPYTKETANSHLHFSHINEFSSGDVKAVWEFSRFTFTFDLVRGYARDRDEAYSRLFWDRFEDWCIHNPPYQGINWKCGQESAIRLIACLFGFQVFHDPAIRTRERRDLFLKFVFATANRIEKNIGYAVSQKNNHGISESAVLWAVGTLFPCFKDAARWRSTGSKILAKLCNTLIYDDGGFCQHSANYHRLLLHVLAWTIRIDAVNQNELPDSITQRFRLASQFLIDLTDPQSGIVPRYGSDDGALLLPLSHCPYEDYRPATQLSSAVLGDPLPWKSGAWDEELVWFGLSGSRSGDASPKPSPVKTQSRNAGCHVLRDDRSSAMIRAGNYVHRPAQLDMLHVDLMYRGVNVAIDPGTYSYNGAGVWGNNPLALQKFHNTVGVDGTEPSIQVSKFLFLPWNQCTEVPGATESNSLRFRRQLRSREGQVVSHERCLVSGGNDRWIVIDHLNCDSECDFRLHWLLVDRFNQSSLQAGNKPGPFELELDVGNYSFQLLNSQGHPDQEVETDVQSGCDESPRGWFAPYYLERSPAISITATKKGKRVSFVSYFGPELANPALVSGAVSQSLR